MCVCVYFCALTFFYLKSTYIFLFQIRNVLIKNVLILGLAVWDTEKELWNILFFFERMNSVVILGVAQMLQITFPVASQTPSAHRWVRGSSHGAKLQLPRHITTYTSASASPKRDAPLIQTTTPTMHQCLTCITSPSVWFPNWRCSVYYTNVSHARTPTFTRINQDEDRCQRATRTGLERMHYMPI